MDTQWPRFEVFKRDKATMPHQAVGSVHAPDAEMALLMARDVHVRRPDCISLWVAPERDILMVTAEELASETADQDATPSDAATEIFEVFTKTSQRRAMTFVNHVGAVRAVSARAALTLATQRFAGSEVWVWWVVPASAIVRSEDAQAEIASWFDPAREKTFKNQSHYGDVGGLRKLRREREVATRDQPMDE